MTTPSEREQTLQRRIVLRIGNRQKISEMVKELKRLKHRQLACEVRKVRVKAGSEKC